MKRKEKFHIIFRSQVLIREVLPLWVTGAMCFQDVVDFQKLTTRLTTNKHHPHRRRLGFYGNYTKYVPSITLVNVKIR